MKNKQEILEEFKKLKDPTVINGYQHVFDWLSQTLDTFEQEVREDERRRIEREIDGMNEQNQITQLILDALEYRGFHDCGKYLDGDIWERLQPQLIKALN